MNDTPQTLEKDVRDNLLLLYDFDKNYDVKLLKYSENVIFKITFKEAPPVVFRIHRPGYHNIEELEGEILWMDEIHRDTDVELPVVYRGRNGGFLQKMTTFSGEEVYVSVISFLEGSPLGELKADELIEGLESLGEITAKLHMQSINRDKRVVIKRFYWDINNLFGDNNDGIWGSWRDYKALTKEQYRILEKCTSVMKDKLNHYGRSNEKFGLIHADLHFYNVINNNGVNQIIDFDDSGYGFYMYDMGCALVTYSRNLAELEEAWVRGYEKVRKLSDEDKKLIPMFVLLRRITRLAWLATHSDSDTAKTVDNEYLDVTIDMAKEWLKANTKVAVITGAAGGIGYGIAKKFLEAGYKIAIIGRSQSIYEAGKNLTQYAAAIGCGTDIASGELSADTDDTTHSRRNEAAVVRAYKCDISDVADVENTVNAILKDYSKIDVLVNNAGIAKIKEFDKADNEFLINHINTNIMGTWNMTHSVIGHMKDNRFGRIINMSSVTGAYECDKGYSAYATTKAAIIGFTKAIAAEYAGYGITSNAICPGFIMTPNVLRSAKTTNPDNPDMVIAKIANAVPVGKLGTPEQIGSMAVYLASDDAEYVTGTANIIDGGNIIPETGVMGTDYE